MGTKESVEEFCKRRRENLNEDSNFTCIMARIGDRTIATAIWRDLRTAVEIIEKLTERRTNTGGRNWHTAK